MTLYQILALIDTILAFFAWIYLLVQYIRYVIPRRFHKTYFLFIIGLFISSIAQLHSFARPLSNMWAFKGSGISLSLAAIFLVNAVKLAKR